MKTAAIILYVIQAIAILCAVITGQEFIDFSSGPALFETIGFFSPAILGAILEMIANNKKQKAGGQTIPVRTQAIQTLPPLLTLLQPKPLQRHRKPQRLRRCKKPQGRIQKPLRPQQSASPLSTLPFSTTPNAERNKTPKTFSASPAVQRSDNNGSRTNPYCLSAKAQRLAQSALSKYPYQQPPKARQRGPFFFRISQLFLDVHCGTHIQAAICVLFKPSRGHSYRGRHIQANKLLVMQLTFVLSYLLVVVEERGRPPYRPLASCHPAVLRRRPCISPVDISQHSSLQDSNTTMVPSLSIR